MMKAKVETKVEPYFKIGFNKTEHLDIFQTLKEISETAKFELTEKGLMIRVIDKALVCLANYFIPKENLYKFETNKKSIEFVLNTELLYRVLKLLNYQIKIELQSGKLWVSDTTTKYILPLLDEGEFTELDINQLEWNFNFKLSSSEFKEFIKKSEWISDAITFEIKGGVLEISAENDTVKVEIKKRVGLSNNVKVKYPLEYLKKIKVDGDYRIYIKKDYPMKLEAVDTAHIYKDDKQVEKEVSKHFTMIVAPRIEEE